MPGMQRMNDTVSAYSECCCISKPSVGWLPWRGNCSVTVVS